MRRVRHVLGVLAKCEVVASAAGCAHKRGPKKTSDTLFHHEPLPTTRSLPYLLPVPVLTVCSQPQCDEGVPTCRNCQKSKRECLGYDPIFKQQPSPANIQPAPSIHPQTPSASASAPPNYHPSGQYGPPHAYPGTGGTFMQAAGLPRAEHAHFDSHYGNGPSLDPALSSGDQPHHMAHLNNYPNALQPTRTGKR